MYAVGSLRRQQSRNHRQRRRLHGRRKRQCGRRREVDHALHDLRLDWITVEPAGGSRGIFAVRLSFGANGTGSPRTGTVTFTAGSCKETYTFTQKAE